MKHPPRTLTALFRDACEAHGARPFLHDADGAASFAEVARAAEALALRLRDCGVTGGRAAVMLPNGRAYVAAFFGVLLAGGTVVPIDPRLKPREVRFVLEHCGCVALVAAVGPSASLRDAVPPGCVVLRSQDLTPSPFTERRSGGEVPQDADAPAVVLSTSGSTAQPKAVVLTHGGICDNALAWSERYALTEGDVILGLLSFCHSFGMTACMCAALAAGAGLVVPGDALPLSVATATAEHGVTVFVAASSYYQYLVRAAEFRAEATRAVRLFLGGATSLPGPVARGFEAKFGRGVLQTYGLTEASPVVTGNVPSRDRPGTVGTALAGVSLRVVDDAGVAREAGRGELQVRGSTVMQGYLDNPGATAACLDAEGWLRTGDDAEIDAEGCVTLLGRRKDLIIRGGNKLFPDEIEEVLLGHPCVAEAAVVGMPDPVYEEVPVAFVVVREGARCPLEAEVLAWCRERMAAFKVPRYVRLVAALPRNHTGKILRRALRESLVNGVEA